MSDYVHTSHIKIRTSLVLRGVGKRGVGKRGVGKRGVYCVLISSTYFMIGVGIFVFLLNFKIKKTDKGVSQNLIQTQESSTERMFIFAQTVWAAPPKIQKVSTIDQLPQIKEEISYLSRQYLDPALRVHQNRFIVKLTEGRIKYLAEDYRTSAMILLELVETYDQDKKNPIYQDALFYLADSLYHIGNLRTSKQFFKEVLQSKRKITQPCALGRLLEIAIRTDQVSAAQRYQSKAISAVNRFPDPNLLYLLGKYSYRLQRFREADRLWRRVSETSSVYPQTLYFRAVAALQLKQIDQSLALFEKVKKIDINLLRLKRNQLRKSEELSKASVSQCTFRSTQEQLEDEKGWELILGQAELAIARIFYENGQFDKAMAAYLNMKRESPLFRQAIKESVWVAIKQGSYSQALQRLDVQLIDEPNMINDPKTRILQGKLLNILGRFSDAHSIFQELRERFEILKSSTISPILRRAKGQLAKYFQNKLQNQVTALNLEALIPKEAIRFTEGLLSTRVARSLFVELAALQQDINVSKVDIKKLNWVLNGPNQSEIFPTIHRGLLKSLELRYTLLDIQRQLNDKGGALERSEDYLSLLKVRDKKIKSLKSAPKTVVQLDEREAKIERSLMIADLKTYRLNMSLHNLRSQLVGLDHFLKDLKPDQIVGGLSPRERKVAARQVRKELQINKNLIQKANRLSEQINFTQLHVGLYDNAFKLEDKLRTSLLDHLQKESEWLTTRQHFSVNTLEDLQRHHRIIDDFQKRSLKLVQQNSFSLKGQVQREERKIKRYEKRLIQLTRQANFLGGQIVAHTFYRVLEKINELILEADAGLLDVFWSQKKSRSTQLERERDRRRMHFKVLNRDMVDTSF